MKEYTYICRRGDDGRHTWVEYCPWTDGREGGHFVAVPPVPADVTHLTLVPAEGYLCNTAFGNNLFAPINSEKWRYKNWGPYNALEVITLADGFDIVGDWTLGGLGFYDRRLVPYRDDMAWEAPNLREVRLPATVYHIRQGVLDDLDAAVLVASESPYYYNTPDGALYDRRTNALVYIPTCREFLFSSKAMLAPAKNSLRTDYPLVDETPLSALRGAVRRGLRSVVIPKESKLANHWKIVDGVLYDRVLGAALLCLDPERKSWKAPDWCGCVMPNAFAGCRALESVTMTAPGVKLYPDAFFDCLSLQQLQLPRDAELYRGRRYPALDFDLGIWTEFGLGQSIDVEPKPELCYRKSDEELAEMSAAERAHCKRQNEILALYESSFSGDTERMKIPLDDYVYGYWPRPVVTPVPEHSELCSLYGCVDAQYPTFGYPKRPDPLKTLERKMQTEKAKAARAQTESAQTSGKAPKVPAQKPTTPAPAPKKPLELRKLEQEYVDWFILNRRNTLNDRECDALESIHFRRCEGFCISGCNNLREVKNDVLQPNALGEWALQISDCPQLERVEVLSLALPIGDKFEWSRAKDFGALPNLKMLVLPEQFKAYHDDIMAAGGPVPVYSKAAPDKLCVSRPTPHPKPELTGRKYINSAKFAARHDPFAKALALSSEEQLELVLQD